MEPDITVLGKQYAGGHWVSLPHCNFSPADFDPGVMPVFDIRDICAPDWVVEGCC